jgi:hypothetical protein
VASVLQAKLGARVQVGSISLGFLNRIVIDDFDLRDQQGNHLLDSVVLISIPKDDNLIHFFRL